MTRRCFLFVAGFLALFVPPIVPVARADRIDDHIRAEMKKHQVPGLALAIIKEGRVVRAKGYGLASIELQVPVRPDTVFELASLTKQFTAAAIMLLVEDGKVALDDPISKYIESVPEQWRAITVRHLLTHTAGLTDEFEGPEFHGSVLRVYRAPVLLQHAFAQPLLFAPGERWWYSDTGYLLLGHIIEKASEEKYHEFVKKRIFEPLGMTASDVLRPRLIVPRRAARYAVIDGQLGVRSTPYLEPFSGWGMLSSVLDLAKWDAALYTEKILSRSSLEQMWTPVSLNDGLSYPYGFGWWIRDQRGYLAQLHGGSFGTAILRFPEPRLTVVVLSNRYAGGGWHPMLLAREIAGMYDSRLVMPKMMREKPDPDPRTTETVRQFLTEFSQQKNSELMAPGLRKLLPGNLRDHFAELVQGFRALSFLGCDDLSQRKINRMGADVARTCHYKVITPREPAYVSVWLTADGKVADLLVAN